MVNLLDLTLFFLLGIDVGLLIGYAIANWPTRRQTKEEQIRWLEKN